MTVLLISATASSLRKQNTDFIDAVLLKSHQSAGPRNSSRRRGLPPRGLGALRLAVLRWEN